MLDTYAVVWYIVCVVVGKRKEKIKMKGDLPENDEQAEQALRHDYGSVLGDALAGIYRCRRAKGLSVLEAFEAALLAHVEANERASQTKGESRNG